MRQFGEPLATLPLVAIGGITRRTLRDVIDAGADSVAVISALLSDPDRITEATRALLPALSIPNRVKHNFLAFIIVMRENRTGFGRHYAFRAAYLPAVNALQTIPCGVPNINEFLRSTAHYRANVAGVRQNQRPEFFRRPTATG